MIAHYYTKAEEIQSEKIRPSHPKGTRDQLFDERIAKRTIQEKLRKIFTAYGYSEVITPGLEFYEVFNGKVHYFPSETMYKLVDGKNRLMVLRPDNTMPIARLAATRLRAEKLPLKLYCNQSIFMVNPKNSGRDDEFTQVDIEILGGESKAADYEALSLAAQSLFAVDEDFRLEIGESGIFRTVVDDPNLPEEKAELIHALIENKNYPALNEALEGISCSAAEAVKALPSLFGESEVFEAAEKYMYSKELRTKSEYPPRDLRRTLLDGIFRQDKGRPRTCATRRIIIPVSCSGVMSRATDFRCFPADVTTLCSGISAGTPRRSDLR